MEQILLLGQSDQIVGWLTPVWIMSVGVALGLILVYLCKGLIFGLSKIPGLNQLNESPTSRIVSSSVVAVLVMCGILGYLFLKGDLARITAASDIALLAIYTLMSSVIFGFGFIAVVSSKRFDELLNLPKGNFASWLNKIAIGMSVFAVLGFLLSMIDGFGSAMFVEKPMEKMSSLMRLSKTGPTEVSITVPSKSELDIDANFFGQELKYIQFKADQEVEFAAQPLENLPTNSLFIVFENDEYSNYRRQPGDARIPDGQIEKFYFRNHQEFDAEVTIRWFTQVEFPQVSVIPRIALVTLAVFVLYWMFCAACPKISAIAVSTFKTEISQPVFILLGIVGCVFAVGSIYIPYYTLGEDIKMYKMSALTLIRIMGIFMAIWAASKSVAEEIEGRTALTVLSKPVGRRQFILGKFSGISLAIGLMFVIVGLWFLIWVCYKPIYDTRENSMRDFAWFSGFDEAAKTIPGLILAYFESLVFVAISIAISTRLGILANFMLCFAIYVLGHLTPMIVQSAEAVQAFEPVVVFGQFISVIFPVLDHFDVEPAIIGEVDVPLSYLGWSSVYCLVYGTIAMLLSLVMFEDRDLA